MFNGQGKLTLVKDEEITSVYEGKFKNNLRSGLGKETLPDKEEYNGNWKNDKRQGKGVIIYQNGDKFQGTFVDGKIDG